MKLKITHVMVLTTAMVSGIILCKVLMPVINIETWELLVTAAIWCAALIILNKKEAPKAFKLATMLLLATIGALLFLLRYDSVRHGVNLGNQHFVGIITDKPQRKAKTWAVKLKVEKGGMIIAYLAPDCEPQKGDSIEVFCPFGAESTCTKDNPDSTFADYHNYLFNSGISATAYSPTGQWRVISHHEPKGVFERLKAVQSEMVRHYAEAGFRGNEGAIIMAMTTGDKSVLSEELRQQYSQAGVAHVLALSGFHLTIIYTIIELLIIGRMPRLRWRIWGRGVTMLALCAFTIMAGSPPSLVRAFIMCAVMIVSSMIRHGNIPMNSLFLAISIMLAYNPMMFLDAGFQLSVMSMMGLTSVCDWMTKIIDIRQWGIHRIWGLVSSTIVCTLFTLPLVTYYFGYIPLLSVLSNLVVPFLAIIMMYIAIIWWILTPLPLVQDFVGDALTVTVRLMNQFTQWISSMDWAILPFRSTLFGAILEYFLLAILLYLVTLIYRRAHPIL